VNFLALAQRAAVECGVASTVAIGTALPTVVGAAGSLGRIVNWVGDAWNDIQTRHDDWEWMRSSNLLGKGASFVPAAGQASTPIGIEDTEVGIAWAAFGKWDRESFRNYTTSVGFANEMFLDEIPFDTWRDSYMLGAMREVQTRPVVVAVGPDQSLNLGPPPNGLYTITGDYFMAPAVMAADIDVPLGLAARFHMLIVYIAMMKYAGYESAPEVFQRGSAESVRMYGQLEALRLPIMSFGGALA
jgi:hypothetical protein